MGLFYRRQEGSFHLCFWLATNSCSSWNTISWNKSQYLFIGFLTKTWDGHSNFTFYSSLTKWPAQIHFFLIIWFGFPNVWCKSLSFPHCVLHVFNFSKLCVAYIRLFTTVGFSSSSSILPPSPFPQFWPDPPSFTLDGPIPQMILPQSKQIWRMCTFVCIRVKFTFQSS